jgi:hypothetical protein
MSLQHQPFDLSKQQIRLIKLLPQKSCSQPVIHMSITVFDFESAPAYTALSYTWGSPTPTTTIFIDGHSFQVRGNLYDFLSLSQAENQIPKSCLFWIDQICINQEDEREKGHQVQFMGEIFRRAYNVIAWLGMEDDNSRFTITWMQKVERRAAQLSIKEKNYLWAFFSRRYWSRLWIVQELLLAQEVVFLCGTMTFTWHDIPTICLRDAYMMYNTPNASALCQLFQQSKPLTLSSALQSIHGKASFQCTLPHDVVYGLLGLVSPTERVPVDYSMSLTEMIVQVVDHALPYLVEIDVYEAPDAVLPSLQLLLDVCYRAMGIPWVQQLDLKFSCSKVVQYFRRYDSEGKNFYVDYCNSHGIGL